MIPILPIPLLYQHTPITHRNHDHACYVLPLGNLRGCSLQTVGPLTGILGCLGLLLLLAYAGVCVGWAPDVMCKMKTIEVALVCLLPCALGPDCMIACVGYRAVLPPSAVRGGAIPVELAPGSAAFFFRHVASLSEARAHTHTSSPSPYTHTHTLSLALHF